MVVYSNVMWVIQYNSTILFHQVLFKNVFAMFHWDGPNTTNLMSLISVLLVTHWIHGLMLLLWYAIVNFKLQ